MSMMISILVIVLTQIVGEPLPTTIPTSAPSTFPATRVHDPAMIRAGQYYYVFSTGSGIKVRRSKDLIEWENLSNVFARLPDWTQTEIPGARGLWAPDIQFYRGQYYLYYTVSGFGRNRSCIGLANNKSLDPNDPAFQWIDHGKVIETHRTDNWNAIDPNLIVDEKGEPWLVAGSFWSGIKLRKLDALNGMVDATDTKLYSLASRPGEHAIEAPYMIRHDKRYYLFVSFDHCCKGDMSDYNIRVGRSDNITGPFVDKDGVEMLKGGGTMVLQSRGRIRGPGHCAILSEPGRDLLIHHYYDASDNGQAKLQIRPITWSDTGWPVAGDAIGGTR